MRQHKLSEGARGTQTPKTGTKLFSGVKMGGGGLGGGGVGEKITGTGKSPENWREKKSGGKVP